MADPGCRTCHECMDPIGFGFENYDGIGTWRLRDGEADIDASGFVQATTDVQFELAAQALACDVTRMVGPQSGREGSTGTATWLNQNVGIHTASHWQGTDEATAIQWMTDLNRWYTERLAAFFQLLFDKGAWDDTLILWTMALTEGARHNTRNVPTVLIQGGDAYFDTGRYLKYGNFPDIVPSGQSASNADFGGDSMSRVLTSVCHAMGFEDVESFGDAKFGSGALPRL